MSDVLFIHSAGPQGDAEGSGRLVAALRSALPRDFKLSAPMMPDPSNPDAGAWSEAFGEHLEKFQAPFVLVGHSLGGSTILKYLAEHQMPSGLTGVISIAAPFWGADMPQWMLPADFAGPLTKLPRLVFYHSRYDDMVPFSNVERYADALPRAVIRRFDGRGHLFDNGKVDDIVADICF
jgi:predicted alpha/beta hydrolase family esterase